MMDATPLWIAIIGLAFTIIGGLFALGRYLVKGSWSVSERMTKIADQLEMTEKGFRENEATRARLVAENEKRHENAEKILIEHGKVMGELTGKLIELNTIVNERKKRK
jgi:hypothetical protein